MADEIERANAYNTAVGGVGYAGILTIFSLTHAMIEPETKAVVALLFMLSTALYVSWVVATMFARVRRAQGKGQTLAAWINVAWIFDLGGTVATALGAAGIMAWYYVEQIVS